MTRRDLVEDIVTYNLPLATDAHRVLHEDGTDLTAEALQRKFDAFARSPFAFFRGTYHLMAHDLAQARVPHAQAAAPDALIVGDLHLENFGVYRGTSGTLCFDVNDFDDVGIGPADLDLKRLCTSALLLPDVSATTRLAAAKTIARAWAETIEKVGGRYPIAPLDEARAEPPVTGLFKEKGKRTREELIAKVAPGKGHERFGEDGEPRRFAHVSKSWHAVAERALTEYLDQLKALKVRVSHVWDVLDIAYRFKGLGSLGRLRFSALLGSQDQRRIIEVKEARPSALGEALGRPADKERARVQTASIRRLQADPWPRVAGTHLGKVPALCREVQTEEEKLGTARFTREGDLDTELLMAYARQCGELTARLVMRASAPVLLGADWKPVEAARAAVEFAQSYAQIVEADQRAFLKARPAIEKALSTHERR